MLWIHEISGDCNTIFGDVWRLGVHPRHRGENPMVFDPTIFRISPWLKDPLPIRGMHQLAHMLHVWYIYLHLP